MSPYTTIIKSNGSKWMGDAPDSLEVLFDRLATTPLDATFERFGNFILAPTRAQDEGRTRFWGNFALVSAVFSVDTNDPALIDRLTQAIRSNQQREDYQAR